MMIQPKASITISYFTGSRLPDQVVKCADCQQPIFKIVDGIIHHMGRHHGETHTTTIRLQELDKGR